MKRDSRLYVQDIVESIDLLEEYTKEGKNFFLENIEKQDSVIRRLEIIGEAAKNIPQDLRDKHPEIPLRKITGLRDILIHAYSRIIMDHIWKIIEDDLPELKTNLGKICKELAEGEK